MSLQPGAHAEPDQALRAHVQILKNVKAAAEVRSSVCHAAVIFANAMMHSGTTVDAFLRDNLDWLRRARFLPVLTPAQFRLHGMVTGRARQRCCSGVRVWQWSEVGAWVEGCRTSLWLSGSGTAQTQSSQPCTWNVAAPS